MTKKLNKNKLERHYFITRYGVQVQQPRHIREDQSLPSIGQRARRSRILDVGFEHNWYENGRDGQNDG